MGHLRCREEFHGRTRRVVRTALQVFDQRGLEHLLLFVDRVLQGRILAILLAKLALCTGFAHPFLIFIASSTASNRWQRLYTVSRLRDIGYL